MRVLVVKMSSLGDVVHTLPALTDAAEALPGVRFDWVVEEAFAEVPVWHPAVDEVIPISLRRWRQQPVTTLLGTDWRRFRSRLRAREYDCVIDAQGLIKSALITRQARGLRCGPDRQSAREPLASLAYQRVCRMEKGQHAVTRVRQLFAQALGYACPHDAPDYGVQRQRCVSQKAGGRQYVLFLHGTTWPTKHWPEAYWSELAQRAAAAGFAVRIPWGNAEEAARAQRLSAAGHAEVLPKSDLNALAREIAGARAVVAVDTGLAHVAAALGTPAVTLYGATRAGLTGTWGAYQQHLSAQFPCSPCLDRRCRYRGPAEVQPACYQSLAPAGVWQAVEALIASAGDQADKPQWEHSVPGNG